MRDGKWVATTDSSELTVDKIISQMVGRSLSNRFPERTKKPGELLLSVNNITAKNKNNVKDVSFDLRKGEILGIAGLVGSGRSELLEILFGRAEKKSGNIVLNGKVCHNKSPAKAIKNGFALLTEERRYDGIFSGLDIKFNSCISNIDKYSKFGVLNNNKMVNDTNWVIGAMKVKTPSQKTHIGTLSGGNQQKVIIGRWLLCNPEILLLDEPTRGIDVGAKYEIYQLIIEMASKDKGIIMVSSEMPELLGVCDRIMVMSGGKVAGICDNTKELTQEKIMELAAKFV
jgi:methyl-galactoside transport system ATP-binding protein